MGILVGRIFTHGSLWLIGVVVLALLLGAMLLGSAVARRRKAQPDAARDDSSYDGYIVTAVLGLLALLLGFTFALALDRYDTRRRLVIQEANAIGTTYLRAQLFDEPHRTRLSRLLEGYTRTRLALARVETSSRWRALLAQSDEYHKQLWVATLAAVRPIRHLPTSASFLQAMNETIDIGAARVAARLATIPTLVLAVLLLYMAITAFVLGYVRSAPGRRLTAAVLLGLIALSFQLILDIDRPAAGGVRVPQGAMEDLLATIRHNPPASFGAAAPGPSR